MEAYSKTYRIAVVTSIHPDFDARIWKHSLSLAKAGCTVHLICPWSVVDGQIIEGVHMNPFPRMMQRILRPFIIPCRIIKRLRHIMQKIDLIHFHDIDLLPLMAIFSFLKPVVYDMHENYPEEMLVKDWIPKILRKPVSYMVKWFQSLFCSIIGNIVVVVSAQKLNLRRQRVKIFKLVNYATSSLVDHVSNDYMRRKELIVFTGSGYESNGSLLLLETAKILKPLYPQMQFLVVDRFASIKFKKKFIEKIKKEGLSETIIIFRRKLRNDLMMVLNQAIIGIAPNLRVAKQQIAIPTKLFEYMAAGIPIVSSDLPYQRKLFTHDEIGILAQPEDPKTFAEAIKKLVDNRSYALRLGSNGQKAFLAKYCWETQIPALLKFYHNALECSTK